MPRNLPAGLAQTPSLQRAPSDGRRSTSITASAELEHAHIRSATPIIRRAAPHPTLTLAPACVVLAIGTLARHPRQAPWLHRIAAGHSARTRNFPTRTLASIRTSRRRSTSTLTATCSSTTSQGSRSEVTIDKHSPSRPRSPCSRTSPPHLYLFNVNTQPHVPATTTCHL